MDIKDFIVEFGNQFDDTDVSLFTPQTELYNLEEWTSLMIYCVIGMIQSNYCVSVNGEEIRECKTIQDLFNLVVTKQ